MTASITRLTELARLRLCGQCWQQPGQPCETSPPGDHLARENAELRARTSFGDIVIRRSA
ncbi:MAG TPA: hypothetical protein VGL63_10005 [Streptosporangiaceae bacterium]|jgi:hypothetical protein